MIKQNQKKFNSIHIGIDIICQIVSLCLSYILCVYIQSLNVLTLFHDNLYYTAAAAVCLIVLHMLCFRIFGLYKSYRSVRLSVEVMNILKAELAAFVVSVFISLLFSVLLSFQVLFAFYFIINLLITSLYRVILRKLLRYIRSKGYNIKYIVLAGVNDCSSQIINKIKSSPDLGYQIIGYFNNRKVASYEGLPYLGQISGVHKYFSSNTVDEAIIMLSDNHTKDITKMVDACERWGIKFSMIPNIFSLFGSRIYTNSFDGLPVLSMRNVPLDRTFNAFIKRLGDIFVSSLMLILLSPFMGVVALIIKITTHGKVIFRQKRVGLGRRPFTMYKFCSMREDTEKDLTMTKKNDQRCTPFGRFIRRFSIDELPQLWNVLKGDMSLVGPRPEIPYYVKQFKDSVPSYMIKHYVKPGITGWAQVNGLRGSGTSIEKRIEYDLYYIENWTPGLDIKILFMTLFKGIFSKNAY